MMSTIATRLREGRGLALSLLALMPLLFTGGAADAQAVYPPNTVFAAGTVYPSADIKSGSMAGGYFGNGSGKIFDLAVTNSTGVGWVLSVFPGNGDGTFAAAAELQPDHGRLGEYSRRPQSGLRRAAHEPDQRGPGRDRRHRRSLRDSRQRRRHVSARRSH
jgi:hypothetical protein